MNYALSPFVRGEAGTRARPLPDDVDALRFLYPDPSAIGSKAFYFTNSWINPDEAITDEEGRPIQLALTTCRPNGGERSFDRWDSSWSGVDDWDGYRHCGGMNAVPNFAIAVCPGDDIYTGVTVNNVGTVALDVEMRAFFSTDDQLSLSDVPSPTVNHREVDAPQSKNAKRSYQVPELEDGAYTVIIVGNAPGADVDWIPLRGEVYVSAIACERQVPSLASGPSGPWAPPVMLSY